MSNLKVGDKVTIQALVVEVHEQAGVRLSVGDYGREVWLRHCDCKPVEPEAVEQPTSDPVNPSHYKQGSIECIEAIKAALGNLFRGFLWGNVLRYLWRWPNKNGIEDLKKARWYLDRLIQEEEAK